MPQLKIVMNFIWLLQEIKRCRQLLLEIVVLRNDGFLGTDAIEMVLISAADDALG